MTDQAAIENWLDHNAPRRFEPGASMNIMGMRFFLEERGYETAYTGWQKARRCIVKRVGQRGQPKKLTEDQLIDFVDAIRVQEGLTPFRPKNGGKA